MVRERNVEFFVWLAWINGFKTVLLGKELTMDLDYDLRVT